MKTRKPANPKLSEKPVEATPGSDVPQWVEKALREALSSLQLDVISADAVFHGRALAEMQFGFGRVLIDLGDPDADPVETVTYRAFAQKPGSLLEVELRRISAPRVA
jgi:hypothetical protein